MISDKCSLGQIEFLIEQLKDNKISDIIDLSDAWDLLPEKLTIKQKGYIYHLMNTPPERSKLPDMLINLGFKRK